MFVGIMVASAAHRRRTLLLYQRLVIAQSRLPLRLMVFCPQHIDFKSKIVRALLLEKNGSVREKWCALPFAIINRCYGTHHNVSNRLRQLIGEQRLFNSVTQFDKWTLYRRLCQAKLRAHVPHTMLYRQQSLLHLLEQPSSWFVKPVRGNRGEAVHRINKTATGELHVASHTDEAFWHPRDPSELHRLFQSTTNGGWLIQKAIDTLKVNDRCCDIRALMQKGRRGRWQCTALTCRVARAGFFNTSAYSAVYTFDKWMGNVIQHPPELVALRQKIKTLAQLAATAAETKNDALAEVSVDFVLDVNRHLWILELNASPQKSIYREIRGFRNMARLYLAPLQYAVYLYEQQ